MCTATNNSTGNILQIRKKKSKTRKHSENIRHLREKLGQVYFSQRLLGLLLGSLRNDVFERRTSTGSGLFALFSRGFEEILGQNVSLRV